MGSLSLSFRQPTFTYLFCVLFLWWSMLSFLYSSVSYTQGQLLGLHLGDPSAQLQRRQWHPTAGLLPRKSHGRRSLKGCSPWGCWRSDTTEQLHFHFSLSCIGEGNGNPLQCSCLENPRDGGAWWAAVFRVAQSRTRLKWLSSSSSAQLNALPLLKFCCCNLKILYLWIRDLILGPTNCVTHFHPTLVGI